MIPSKAEVLNAFKRVQPMVHRTPVLTSRAIDKIAGASLYFKCENFQRGGSFKIRGALNAVLQLTEEQREKGVVTHSSGNFAQGLALAALESGTRAFIVMPDNAPKVKKEAVKSYGGEVILCRPTLEAREATAARIQKETGATFIHPYDDIHVILGQSTAASELLQDIPALDYLLTPVGGGGLVSGTLLAAHYHNTPVAVIGGEPLNVNDAYRSIKAGERVFNTTIDTLADGLRTNLGVANFSLMQQLLHEIICVSEQEIIQAMKLVFERMKLVIEPSSAVPLAAVLARKDLFQDKKTGVVLSGGNVDVLKLPF